MSERGLEFEQFDIDGRYIVRGLMIHNYAREVGATDDESFQALLDFHKVERVTGDVGGVRAALADLAEQMMEVLSSDGN